MDHPAPGGSGSQPYGVGCPAFTREVQQFQWQIVAVGLASVGYISHNQRQRGTAVIAGLKTDPTLSDNHQMLECRCHKFDGHTVFDNKDKSQAACNHSQAVVLLVHQAHPSLPEDEEGGSPAENSHLTLDFWHDSAKI